MLVLLNFKWLHWPNVSGDIVKKYIIIKNAVKFDRFLKKYFKFISFCIFTEIYTYINGSMDKKYILLLSNNAKYQVVLLCPFIAHRFFSQTILRLLSRAISRLLKSRPHVVKYFFIFWFKVIVRCEKNILPITIETLRNYKRKKHYFKLIHIKINFHNGHYTQNTELKKIFCKCKKSTEKFSYIQCPIHRTID